MKGVIASAVIAVVIVAGSVAYTNHIDKVSRDLGEINDRVMAFLYDGDYESAGDEIEKLVPVSYTHLTLPTMVRV